ncbi:MAG TPA: glycosyltransferase family 2 protein [Puia sp.]|nr:glycosyltransferase family 2 protein [Puia sp.]
MGLSIIIINYRTPKLLIDCLAELYRDPESQSFEIIIVDNDSRDDSREHITLAFPGVKWHQMAYNAGFSRANNAGMKLATGDTVLLLNADTLPRGEVVAECYRRLKASTFVAAGVQLLNADGSHQISGNYAMRGGLNYLLPLPYLGKAVKWLGERTGAKKPHVSECGVVAEVDWINGAFLMVKKDAITMAGPMDEDFFLYAEEAEWCGRLSKIGKLCLYGDLQVIHFQGSTAVQLYGQAAKGYVNLYDRKGLQLMLSNFVRIRKQFGVGWFLFQLFWYLLDIPVFFGGLVVSRIGGKRMASVGDFGRYCRNVWYIVRKTGIIIRNKPHFYKVL